MLYDVVMGHFISRWLILTVAAGVMVAVLPGMHAIGEPRAWHRGVRLVHGAYQCFHKADYPCHSVAVLDYFVRTGRTGDQLAVHAACVMVGAVVFSVGVTIDGFAWSVLGSLVMTIVSGIVGGIIGD